MDRITRAGFTLVELIVVIAVIGILAAIVAVGYPSWRSSTTETSMKNDLLSFASAMESERNFNNGYPLSIPTGFQSSEGNVLQLVGATDSYYCVDAYNPSFDDGIISYDSVSKDFRGYPCSGISNGTVGGTMPGAPRNTNLAGDFTNWQLTGTASVSGGILTLGTNGSARSPLIRVDSPSTFAVGGDMKAEQQATYASLQPNAGFHAGSSYYAADGTTLVQNNGGYTGNGCAESFTRSGWQNGLSRCTWWAGGPNVIYMRLVFYSSASGYSSPDLQIRNPLLIARD